MDQPTSIEIKIKGKEIDVKRAANAAQRRIDLETRGFDENNYIFGDGSDFEERMDDIMGILGSYDICSVDNDIIEFESEQSSYGCTSEEDIKGIANDMIKESPNVEFHIESVITDTYSEGYDLCVDADYANGELKVVTDKDYYEEDSDEEE